ncbi:density-regulated protein homolog [Babylonia areolata]|uniref:density-regulated protein homolog n=1 Tax=Babylonia areolata TaxID=304850 RepID=UPI003FD41DF5
MAEAEGPVERQFLTYDGPQKGVSYPVRVVYCGECTMPIEYCEYYVNSDKCKEWLQKNLPKEFEKLSVTKDDEGDGDKKEDGAAGGGEEKKKRQTRGGKGLMKAKKKVEPQGVRLWTASRGKKKKVTIVVGLASYEIDLKDASKFFATKFSCGSSVSSEDEIVIQGDVKYDLLDILPEKWPQIDEDDIDDMGEKK